MRNVVLSLGFLLALAGAARAEETPIEASDLPKPVAEAVKTKFPKGELTKAVKEQEDEATVFEVTVKVEDKAVEVSVSERGTILEIERSVPVDKLPQTVAEAIAANYPDAKIKQAEHVVAFDDEGDDEEEEDEEEPRESKFFEIVLVSEGKPAFEVKIAPNGKFLEEEDESEDGDDEDEEENDG